MGMRMSG